MRRCYTLTSLQKMSSIQSVLFTLVLQQCVWWTLSVSDHEFQQLKATIEVILFAQLLQLNLSIY